LRDWTEIFAVAIMMKTRPVFVMIGCLALCLAAAASGAYSSMDIFCPGAGQPDLL